MENEHDFSTAILNNNKKINSITMHQVSVVLFKISVSPSSSYSWTDWLTGDWRNWHHPHDCSFPSSNLSCLRPFLNKNDSMHRECLLCHTHWHPTLPHGYCHGWLCGVCAPALMCRYDVFYKKKIQRDQPMKESAGSNQQALSDARNFQITEVMLKELRMFCNQF